MTSSNLYLLQASPELKFKVLSWSVWENAPNTYEIFLLHKNITTGLAKKEKCNLLYHYFFVILSFLTVLPLHLIVHAQWKKMGSRNRVRYFQASPTANPFLKVISV